jgi:hypothetical protein
MKKLAILFPLLILLLPNCKKENGAEFVWDEDCIPLSEQKKIFQPPTFTDPAHPYISVTLGSLGISCLDVNPFDGDEFLLLGKPSENSTNFYRYHAKTGERIYLPRDILMTSRPRWSRKGWILFEGQSGSGPGPYRWDAYKMKSNGDSLTQLTYMGNIFQPEWNWEGDKFVCYQGLTSISMVFDENGTILDTIKGRPASHHSWRHPVLRAVNNRGAVLVTNPIQGDTLFFKMPPFESLTGFTGGVEWIDEENIVWSYEHGVFRTNILTQETVQLIASCDAITYEQPVYSFQTGKLIFKRVSRKFTTHHQMVKGEFVLVDPFDGTQEVIDIDGY